MVDKLPEDADAGIARNGGSRDGDVFLCVSLFPHAGLNQLISHLSLSLSQTTMSKDGCGLSPIW